MLQWRGIIRTVSRQIRPDLVPTLAKMDSASADDKIDKEGDVEAVVEKTVVRKNDKTGETFTFFFGKECVFSQWYPAEFRVGDEEYNCAEQYMMHQKAVLFKDDEMAAEILKSHDPKEQKAMGRKVKNFDPKVWNENCKEIVKRGNEAKFGQNADLKKALLATQGTSMVEASPRDMIWGIGLGGKNPKAVNRGQWRGTNWLGEILTQVRTEMKK